MTDDAVLVLEIGNEARFFEAAFPALEVVWLPTQLHDDAVLLVATPRRCSQTRLRARKSNDHAPQPATAPRHQDRARWRQRHVNPGEKVGLVGAQRRGQVQPVRAAGRPAAGRPGRLRDPRALAPGRGRAAHARDRRFGHRLRARRRHPADGSQARARRGRGRRRRRGDGARAHGARRGRRLRRARARAGPADGPGLQARPGRRAGQQLLRRLAHAPASWRAR